MDKFKNKLLPILLAILFIVNLISLRNITNLSGEINRLNGRIESLQSSIYSSINNGINEMMEIQKKETSIISNFNYSFGELNNKRVDLILSVKPKIINEDDKFFFSYKSGASSPTLIEAISNDGINFESTIDISVFDSIDLDFIIDDGISKKTESLDPIHESIGRFAAQLNAHPNGSQFNYRDKNIVLSTNYELVHFRVDNDKIAIENPKLSFYKNDELIESFDFKKITQDDSDIDNYRIDLKDYHINVAPQDIILVQISTKDNNGLNYKINVDAWRVRDDKTMDFITHDMGTSVYQFNETIIE